MHDLLVDIGAKQPSIFSQIVQELPEAVPSLSDKERARYAHKRPYVKITEKHPREIKGLFDHLLAAHLNKCCDIYLDDGKLISAAWLKAFDDQILLCVGNFAPPGDDDDVSRFREFPVFKASVRMIMEHFTETPKKERYKDGTVSEAQL